MRLPHHVGRPLPALRISLSLARVLRSRKLHRTEVSVFMAAILPKEPHLHSHIKIGPGSVSRQSWNSSSASQSETRAVPEGEAWDQEFSDLRRVTRTEWNQFDGRVLDSVQ